MQTVYIYTLSHPISKEVRYVGRTKRLKRRLVEHCSEYRNKNCKTHKWYWIKSLKNKNLRPVIEVLDVVSEDECVYWEEFWFEQCIAWGFNLTNHFEVVGNYYGLISGAFSKYDNAKEVISFTKDGKKHKEYKSIKDAIKEHTKNIARAANLNDNTKTANGFLWLKKSDYKKMSKSEFNDFVVWCNTKKTRDPDSIKNKFKKGYRANSVISFTKDGKKHAEYPSVKSAMEKNNTSVCMALRKKCKSANEFLWLYKTEYDEMSELEFEQFINICNTKNVNFFKVDLTKFQTSTQKGRRFSEKELKVKTTKTTKRVHQYDKNLLLINVFPSVIEAARKIGKKISTKNDNIAACISKCSIHNKNNKRSKRSMYDFIWSYEKLNKIKQN